MKRRVLQISLLLVALNLLFPFGECISGEELVQGILERLTKAERSDWREREKVISEIRASNLRLSKSEVEKLIVIFDRESRFKDEYISNLRQQGFSVNSAIEKFHKEYGRDYLGYFHKFADLISSLKDVSAIPSLLRGLQHYSGAVTFAHVIAIGKGAVKALIDNTDSKDRVLKIQSCAVLATWVNAPIRTEDYSISEKMAIKDVAILERIKGIFLKALQDENIDVRSSAVYGLQAFPEDEVLTSLEGVAKNDPYAFSTKFDPRVEYPIREDAKRSIMTIKEKMKKNMRKE